MSEIDKIRGNISVYSNGEYVVLPGTKLYILKTDGSLVACRNDLRNARRITFLSGNKMLLCSSKTVFHMIDLRDGNDLWTAPYTKNELNVADLAVSQDEAFVYTFDQWKGIHFISQLNLQTHEVDIHDMDMDLGATKCIVCDEEGIPCLLKTLSETIGGKHVNQNGIRIHDFNGIDPGGTTTWKAKWSFHDRTAIFFLGSTDQILTNDLCIYEPATGSLTPLLKPEDCSQLPNQTICSCWLDFTKRYVCLMYQRGNVIIDTLTCSIAAQYAADYAQGCLIGNEYWICVNNRICRKPFPSFEEIPPVKLTYNMDWYYSKRPELW